MRPATPNLEQDFNILPDTYEISFPDANTRKNCNPPRALRIVQRNTQGWRL